MQCKRCSFIFRSPIPSKEELATYYACAESPTHNIAQHVRELKAKRRLSYVCKAKAMSQVKSLLDIGSDDGLFLHLVKQNYPHLKVVGIEPSRQRVELARSIYGISNVAECSLEETNLKGTFDLITCFHVLEHVVNPRIFLSKIKAVMDSDSVLCLEIPDASLTKFDLPFGIKLLTPGYKFREHLWFFSAKTFRRLLEQEGFNVISLKFVNFGLQPSVNDFIMKHLSFLFPFYEWFSNIILLPLNAIGRGLQVRAIVKLTPKP